MHEFVEQFLNYLRGMWRHRWYAMMLTWAVVLVGWFVVYRLPDQYEASARVYVDTDSILRPLLSGLAVETNVDQRLRIMTRTLLSRPNLEKVARMSDLDIDAKTPADMEALLDRLAKDIKIRSTHRENLYTITYDDSKPQEAKRVVQSLLTIFVESTLGASRQDSDNAQKFLDQQIKDYEQRLVDAENRLMKFKRQHIGLMPSESGDYFSRLQAAQAKVQQTKLQLNEAEQSRDELKRQLNDSSEDDTMSLLGGQSSSPVTTALDGRIDNLQKKLDDLQLRFTDQYPDVIELKRVIAELKKQRKQEIKAMAKASPDAKAVGNPLYQQRTLAIDQADANIAAIKVRLAAYEQGVTQLRKLVDTVPKVETELKRLNRNYGITKRNYDALVARRESAQLSEDVKQTGDGVRFKVIDPPRVPLTPSGPDRLLFSSLVLLGGLVAGLGLALLLSQIRPAIYDRRRLRDLSGFPVFGAVSRIWTPEILLKRRLEFGAYISISLLLTLAYAGVMWIHSGGSGPGVLLHSLRGML